MYPLFCSFNTRFFSCIEQMLTWYNSEPMCANVSGDEAPYQVATGYYISMVLLRNGNVRNTPSALDMGFKWLAAALHKRKTNTAWCRYNAVNFPTNSRKRHPIAHPLGPGMGCFCGPVCDWYSASVPVIIPSRSYNCGPRYNGTRLYRRFIDICMHAVTALRY